MHLSSKHSDLAHAATTFPKPLFIEWLRFRRKAADVWAPKWRGVPCKRARITILDQCARAEAMTN